MKWSDDNYLRNNILSVLKSKDAVLYFSVKENGANFDYVSKDTYHSILSHIDTFIALASRAYLEMRSPVKKRHFNIFPGSDTSFENAVNTILWLWRQLNDMLKRNEELKYSEYISDDNIKKIVDFLILNSKLKSDHKFSSFISKDTSIAEMVDASIYSLRNKLIDICHTTYSLSNPYVYYFISRDRVSELAFKDGYIEGIICNDYCVKVIESLEYEATRAYLRDRKR